MAHARSLLFAAYWAAWTTLFLAPLAVFLLDDEGFRAHDSR